MKNRLLGIITLKKILETYEIFANVKLKIGYTYFFSLRNLINSLEVLLKYRLFE